MQNFVLFGMQGAGKGTQAKLLAEKYGFRIFETGGELRRLMTAESTLGKQVQEIVSRGDLVPNEIVMEIIANFLRAVPLEMPILFDGIPRSLPQKGTFDALVRGSGRNFRAVFIDISRDEALHRLVLRGRSDDNAAAIERRLENYEKETLPVIEAYEREGILTRVSGMGSVEAIHQNICAVVEA